MRDRPLRFFMAAFILISLISIGPVMAQPDPPGGLQAVSMENGQIQLSWNAVAGATKYQIYQSTIDSIPGAFHKEVTNTSVILTIGGDSLANGVKWYFWVKTVENTEISDPTSSVNAVCDASPPLAVTLSSPLNGSYVIVNTPTLDWDATTDNSSIGDGQSTGVSHYELQISTASDFSPGVTDTFNNINTTEYTTNPLPNSTYYWRVRAHDNAGNALDWTSPSMNERTFIVNMDSPTLLAPANGSSFNDDPPGELPPTFSWTEVDGAGGYLLEVDDQTPISATPLHSYNVSGGSTTSYTPLTVFDDGTYYWRVSATNGGGQSIGVYSSTWSFSVDKTAPDAPTLTSPVNGSTIGDPTPQFTWSDVTDAVSYEIEVSEANTTEVDGSFSTVQHSSAPTTNSHTPASDLGDGLHYWHVRAKDSADNYSDWSAIFSFTVDTTLPEIPTLTSPADEATLEDSTPTFSWSAVAGASEYYLEISTSQTFTTLSVDKTVTNATYTLTAGEALSNGTYYWRVASDLDEDEYSEVRSFTVDVEPTEQPISFQVEVRSGATGDYLDNAQITILSGPTTVDVAETGTTGRASLTAPPGTYTMRVEKNLWDSGDGQVYSKQVTVSAGSTLLYVNLYQTGRDLLVASVHYNDKTSSTPPSIVIYRDGEVYDTVQMPYMPPTTMVPNNLKLAKTNLVIEVPTTGTYEIADPSYTEGKVTIQNLSQTLSSGYVNTVSIQITSSISGLIVDEFGNIITGASVMLLRQSDNAIMGAVETSSIGFLFNLILPDTYYVRAQKSGYDNVVSSTFDVAPHETKNVGMITLTQQKGTLNVTVQSSAGSLLDNVTVEVTNSDGNVVFSQMAAQGIIGIELPGGTYTISATKVGYDLNETVSAVVVAGETLSKTLIMSEQTTPPPLTGSIELSVSDEGGNPLQLVNVYIAGEKIGVTNQDGILLIDDLDPATYELTLKKDGYDDVSMSVTVTAGDTSTNTKSMSETVVTESSSRMKWILIGAAVVIVFAIVLIALTKRKGGEGKPEEEMPEERPPETGPSPRAVERAPARYERPLPPSGRGGIPSTSKKAQGDLGDKEKSGGGIPSQSSK